MKISVIVPVYNVEPYLKECLFSLLNQTYTNLEIILVNDGSKDNSLKICKEYANQDKRIVLIDKPNGGLASSRNAGLDIATGDLISFVDSDDYVDLDMFEVMIKDISTEIDIVCCRGIRFDENGMHEVCFHDKMHNSVLSGDEVVKDILLDNMGSQVVKGLYKSKCWETIRFPLGRLYEDIPVTFKAFNVAKKVKFLENTFYKYRFNTNSISLTKNPLKSYHIFLGFLEHYHFAKQNNLDFSSDVASLACHYAITTYFHYCSDARESLEFCKNDVRDFLVANRKTVNFKKIMFSRRIMLKLFYKSEKLFTFISIFLFKTGLQKLFKLGIK